MGVCSYYDTKFCYDNECTKVARKVIIIYFNP